MGTFAAFVCAAGVAGTALLVLRNRVVSQGCVVNAGAIVLWPLYRGYFLASFILNRSRGGP